MLLKDVIDDEVCRIMVEHGPDGHIDGHEKLTEYICRLLNGYGIFTDSRDPLKVNRADGATGAENDCPPPDPEHLAARGVKKKRGAKL